MALSKIKGTVIADDAINADRIADGTVVASDLLDNTITGAKLATDITISTTSSITASGDLTVDTDTLYVDSTNNRVGIGTSSPQSELQIGTLSPLITASTKSISLGATYSNSAGSNPKLKLYDDGTNYMALGASANRLDFTNSNSLYDFVFYGGGSEIVRIEGTGNVGIGTSSPSTLLHLKGANPNIRIEDNNETASGAISFYDSVRETGRVSVASGASPTMDFNVLGATRVTIDSSGLVGIGTSSPDKLLHLSAGVGATLRFESTTTGATTGDIFGAIEFETRDANNAGVRAKIDAYSEGNVGNTALRFFTGLLTLDEAMRIDSSGNIGIGTSSPNYPISISSSYKGIQMNDGTSTLTIESNTAGQWTNVVSGNNKWQVYTNSANRLVVDGSGNVGIGTSSPTSSLHIQRNTTSGTQSLYPSIHLENQSTGTSYSFLQIETNNGATDGGVLATVDHHEFRTNQYLTFRTGASFTERMRIDSSGNVGIGTSSPSSYLANKLVVATATSDDGITIANIGTNITNYLMFADGTTGLDRYRGAIGYNHNDNSLRLLSDGSERMRIDSSGEVLVGTTSTDNANQGVRLKNYGLINATATSDVCLLLNRKTSDGTIAQFRKDNSVVGFIGNNNAVNGLEIVGGSAGLAFVGSLVVPVDGTGAYVDNTLDLGTVSYRFDDIYATNGTIQTSDQNEKNTITDSDLGLDFVNRLTPKSYIFNGKTRIHYGLIAQEVETVLSDISKTSTDFAGFIKSDISEEQDGSEYRYGLRYNEFIAPMIKAIQELKADNDALRARIETLENA